MSEKNGLTSVQQDVLTKIVNYGDSHGMSSEKIAIAVKAACIESTLGTKMKNDDPKSTASGLFGYTNPNWHRRFERKPCCKRHQWVTYFKTGKSKR